MHVLLSILQINRETKLKFKMETFLQLIRHIAGLLKDENKLIFSFTFI